MPQLIRDTVGDLLTTYRATEGYSTDEYHAAALQHPMAEAKYILACVEMYRARLFSKSELSNRMTEAIDRLRTRRLEPDTGGYAWGLGFEFSSAPANEPYVITTTLVADALWSLISAAPQVASDDWHRHLAETVTYLLNVRKVETDTGTLVAFSPNNSALAYNVTAMWAAVLSRCLPSDHSEQPSLRRIGEDLLKRRLVDAGWPYGPHSVRADLLHTCYVGVALSILLPDRTDVLDPWFVQDVLRFRTNRGWSDRYDMYDASDLLAGSIPGIQRSARLEGDQALIGFDVPARTWSIGELLVLASAAAGRTSTGTYWRRQLRPLAREAIATCLPEPRARHGMHLAHGLAATLRAIRGEARR